MAGQRRANRPRATGRAPGLLRPSRFTLNVTGQDMIAAGYSPSVRLFEAAACATPIISDLWAGLDSPLAPGREIVLAEAPETVLSALGGMAEQDRRSMAEAARRRILADHTAARRAAELEAHVREAQAGRAGASRHLLLQC